MKRLISTALSLLLIHLMSFAQIDNGFDPTNPDDPGAPVQKYLLSLKALPEEGGSFNFSEERYAAGENVKLRAYPNTYYKFVAWVCDGDTISKDDYYTYVMPSKKVQITGVFVYNPNNPEDPDDVKLMYDVNVRINKKGYGSFNFDSERFVPGKEVKVNAYPNTDYVFRHWVVNGEINNEHPLKFVMPANDVDIEGVFDYYPRNPGNPSKNYWNPTTGEVIIDDFEAGHLNSEFSKLIKDYTSVYMITITGVMQDYDFGFSNEFPNLKLVDISRVTGISEITNYAFDGSNIHNIYLPSCIESIGYYAFRKCANLESVTCYATVPPTLDKDAFDKTPEGLIIYVPGSAVNAYLSADVWKDYVIMPIKDDVRNITVELYDFPTFHSKNLWLELTNVKNGQHIHYVMTSSQRYVFPNIIRNTEWNLVIRNEEGFEFGRVNNIKVTDEDVTVKFDNLIIPRRVVMSVLREVDKHDKTKEVDITWTDENGKFIARGNELNDMPAGKVLKYHVDLHEDVAFRNIAPEDGSYVVKDNTDNFFSVYLKEREDVVVRGVVKENTHGWTLKDVMVSASQTYEGKYTKIVTTVTGDEGSFLLKLDRVPTTLTFSKKDYTEGSLTIEDMNPQGSDLVDVHDVIINSVQGAEIMMKHNWFAAYNPNTSQKPNASYFEKQNVEYMAFNKSKNVKINGIYIDGHRMVLMDNANIGDVIDITMSCRDNLYAPVTATVTIDEAMRGNIEFNITEYGKLQASFKENTNANVIGMLYGSDGMLVCSNGYKNARFSTDALPNGTYTLITMGRSEMFNDINSMAKLTEAGLVKDIDYAANSIDIKEGLISTVEVAKVPLFDDSKLYYTDSNSSFKVNKPSITAGNFITFIAKANFKEQYAGKVSNVRFVTGIPHEMKFVENSVLEGSSQASYSIENGELIIPVTKFGERIRFCMIPQVAKDFDQNGFIKFEMDGKTVTQPLGTAHFRADNYTLNVPRLVARTTFPVMGTAPKNSDVSLYDGDVCVGSTKALASGTWSMDAKLADDYNLTRHTMVAKIVTPDGMKLTTDKVELFYNSDAIEVRSVLMDVHNNWSHTNTLVNFDFQKGEVYPDSYSFYQGTDIPFVIDFTNNSPDVINWVNLNVFTEHGNVRVLQCKYDKHKDRWTTVKRFESNDLPINVSVEFKTNGKNLLDDRLIDDERLSIEQEVNTYNELIKEIDNFFASLNPEDDFTNDTFAKLDEVLRIDGIDVNGIGSPTLPSDYDSWTDEEKQKFIDEQIVEITNKNEESSQNIAQLQNLFTLPKEYNQTFEDGTTFNIGNCDGKTEQQLINDGYTKHETTDGNVILTKADNTMTAYYDFTRNLSMVITFSKEVQAMMKNPQSFDQTLANVYGKLQNIKEMINETMNDLATKVKWAETDIAKQIDVLTKDLNKINEYLTKSDLSFTQKLSLKTQKFLTTKNLKITQYVSKYVTPWFRKLMKCIPVVDYLASLHNCYTKSSEISDIYYSIPEPCEDDQERANGLAISCNTTLISIGVWAAAEVAGNITADAGIVGGAIAAAPSGGTSLTVTTWGLAQKAAVIGAKIGMMYIQDWAVDKLKAQLNDLKCDRDDDDDDDDDKDKAKDENKDEKDNDKYERPMTKDVKPIHDPSGFVFEAVPSNRMEGVKATCYYKEMVEDMYGDKHEEIVVWNAEDYAQKNPLFTDKEGKYAWDVPEGMWQVKFEKDGYETSYSEWLPVPPPQLDVNIGMKQNVQPVVKMAKAYDDAIEVTFDKYMQTELLNTENISVTDNGTVIEGTILLIDMENAYEDNTKAYATKVRLNTKVPFSSKSVTINVSNRVKSYAGIRMLENFSQVIPVTPEVKEIVIDSVLTVQESQSTAFVVRAVPAKAAAGKVMRFATSSDIVISLDTMAVTLDNEGKGEIIVNGLMQGSAALTLSVDSTDAVVVRTVNVVPYTQPQVATPKASIASGSEVPEGTEIILTTETEGATIFYTLDGTCPCDESDTSTRIKYESPIIITQDITLRAYAIAEGYIESDIAEYIYTVIHKTSKPEADIPSGSEVKENTEVALTSITEGAVIYYTVDGTDPRIETGTRMVYVSPIIITKDVTIKAYATADGYTDSDVAEFVYTLDVESGIDNVSLAEGLNIYPVPVRSVLNIRAKDKIIERVIVCDVNGILVSRMDKPTRNIVTIDMSSVAPGVYVVYVRYDNRNHRVRIIKQ